MVLVSLVVVLAVAFLARVRYLAGRVGSFECARRLPGRRRWTSGIATFGNDSLEWVRLVSLGLRPRYRIRRAEIELGRVRRRGRDGTVVDVECRYSDGVVWLAMHEDSHSALVAWLESAAPTQPTLF
ncbi:MAG: DUF2550 family protein [Actinomyces sp.]|uniref:DUF2550 family protein n=1 Tax=Actinomyces sp. TaxID=29317 RepID=UPI0026DCD337|nr:DUF2550 family protein [Actinomyces sp.]MDO4242411.1 DUF2550 family protein [Actinomyces sp.]